MYISILLIKSELTCSLIKLIVARISNWLQWKTHILIAGLIHGFPWTGFENVYILEGFGGTRGVGFEAPQRKKKMNICNHLMNILQGKNHIYNTEMKLYVFMYLYLYVCGYVRNYVCVCMFMYKNVCMTKWLLSGVEPTYS